MLAKRWHQEEIASRALGLSQDGILDLDAGRVSEFSALAQNESTKSSTVLWRGSGATRRAGAQKRAPLASEMWD